MRPKWIANFAAALTLLAGSSSVARSIEPSQSVTLSRVEVSILKGLIDSPNLENFDLSPDGKTLAMVVVAGSKVAAPLWIVTVDAGTKRVLASRELGASVFPLGGFSPQAVFASDGNYIVVQDLREIVVLDAITLQTVRSIVNPSPSELQPLYILGAASNDRFACAFGPPQKSGRYIRAQAQIEVVDVSTGQIVGSWQALEVPQAISPDGTMIAVSSPLAKLGVVPLDIFSDQGALIAEFDGGFSFRKADSEPLGRVLGLFAGDGQIFLAPDENSDEKGHYSGDAIRVADLSQTRKPQVLRPVEFGGADDWAISRDRRTAVVITWYLPARINRNEEAWLPEGSSPQLIVLRKTGNWRISRTFPIDAGGFNIGVGWLENYRLRLSADGSAIAIAYWWGVMLVTPH